MNIKKIYILLFLFLPVQIIFKINAGENPQNNPQNNVQQNPPEPPAPSFEYFFDTHDIVRNLTGFYKIWGLTEWHVREVKKLYFDEHQNGVITPAAIKNIYKIHNIQKTVTHATADTVASAGGKVASIAIEEGTRGFIKHILDKPTQQQQIENYHKEVDETIRLANEISAAIGSTNFDDEYKEKFLKPQHKFLMEKLMRLQKMGPQQIVQSGGGKIDSMTNFIQEYSLWVFEFMQDAKNELAEYDKNYDQYFAFYKEENEEAIKNFEKQLSDQFKNESIMVSYADGSVRYKIPKKADDASAKEYYELSWEEFEKEYIERNAPYIYKLYLECPLFLDFESDPYVNFIRKFIPNSKTIDEMLTEKNSKLDDITSLAEPLSIQKFSKLRADDKQECLTIIEGAQKKIDEKWKNEINNLILEKHYRALRNQLTSEQSLIKIQKIKEQRSLQEKKHTKIKINMKNSAKNGWWQKLERGLENYPMIKTTTFQVSVGITSSILGIIGTVISYKYGWLGGGNNNNVQNNNGGNNGGENNNPPQVNPPQPQQN